MAQPGTSYPNQNPYGSTMQLSHSIIAQSRIDVYEHVGTDVGIRMVLSMTKKFRRN